jgi:hypothetical protein
MFGCRVTGFPVVPAMSGVRDVGSVRRITALAGTPHGGSTASMVIVITKDTGNTARDGTVMMMMTITAMATPTVITSTTNTITIAISA